MIETMVGELSKVHRKVSDGQQRLENQMNSFATEQQTSKMRVEEPSETKDLVLKLNMIPPTQPN